MKRKYWGFKITHLDAIYPIFDHITPATKECQLPASRKQPILLFSISKRRIMGEVETSRFWRNQTGRGRLSCYGYYTEIVSKLMSLCGLSFFSFPLLIVSHHWLQRIFGWIVHISFPPTHRRLFLPLFCQRCRSHSLGFSKWGCIWKC